MKALDDHLSIIEKEEKRERAHIFAAMVQNEFVFSTEKSREENTRDHAKAYINAYNEYMERNA